MWKSIVVVGLACSAPALAQTGQECPGAQPAIIRISKIKPNGTMAGFMEAARDHAAWYRAKGIATTQFTAPVLVRTPASRTAAVSKSEVMTIRIGDVSNTSRDAAYSAFTAKYRANSTIVSETRTCFPRSLR